jgi:hypothetical protein
VVQAEGAVTLAGEVERDFERQSAVHEAAQVIERDIAQNHGHAHRTEDWASEKVEEPAFTACACVS